MSEKSGTNVYFENWQKSSNFGLMNIKTITYQIQLPESSEEAFLNIIRSLQNLGVIKSFSRRDNLSQPGEAIPIEELTASLENAVEQASSGAVIPSDQVIAYMKAWRSGK